jgi:hypothetical protein
MMSAIATPLATVRARQGSRNRDRPFAVVPPSRGGALQAVSHAHTHYADDFVGMAAIFGLVFGFWRSSAEAATERARRKIPGLVLTDLLNH